MEHVAIEVDVSVPPNVQSMSSREAHPSVVLTVEGSPREIVNLNSGRMVVRDEVVCTRCITQKHGVQMLGESWCGALG